VLYKYTLMHYTDMSSTIILIYTHICIYINIYIYVYVYTYININDFYWLC
jgi:hypothetical protein